MADPYRLPTTVVPSHYDLVLEPNLEGATFSGEVGIDVEVREATSEIVLNAIELDLDEALVDDAPTVVSYDMELERATLTLPEPIGIGRHRIVIRFRGILNDKLHGFYRSTFTDSQDVEHVIATTQFEATDARRAFPCWDEPEAKATFAITLVVDEGLTAVSNGGEVDTTRTEAGKRRVTFETTMKMSTYLVAFVVGPLAITDPVDVDGVPLRVVAPPERLHLAPFSLEVGAAALRYFSEFFGVPYPAGKLDLVAIPDFAFGAMENLGCVTFRETALLIDPETGSQMELQRVADVVNHEIAHMWFGDLVTMKWWNGIWLNEAFATFMELKATDAQFPEWDRWTSFGLERSVAFQTDSLASTRPVEYPVESPADAEGMFDVLTYQKGCAVMRMLEQYIGEDAFREGLRLYMRRHAYGNTETSDLWDALEEASGDPVRAVMDSWILQGGYPVVSAALSPDRGTLHVEQERFRFLPDEETALWEIPLMVRSSNGEHRALVSTPKADVDLGGAADWVWVNSGAHGFYRVHYDTDLLAAIPVADLTPLERFTLVSDTVAAMVAGTTPPEAFVDLARKLSAFDDADTWQAIAAAFALLRRAAPTPERAAKVEAAVREIAGPAFERVGWEAAEGEAERTGVLRGALVQLLGVTGADHDVRMRARALLDAYLDDRAAVDPDLVTPVLAAVGAIGDATDFAKVVERFRNPATPQEEMRFLQALSGFDDPDLYRRAVEIYLSDEVRSQNVALAFYVGLGRPKHGPAGWRMVRERWSEVLEKIPTNSVARLVQGLAPQTDPAVAVDVRAFFSEHPVPQAANQIAQTLELLDVHARFAASVSAEAR